MTRDARGDARAVGPAETRFSGRGEAQVMAPRYTGSVVSLRRALRWLLALGPAASVSCATSGPLHAAISPPADPCAFDVGHHLVACGSKRIARVICHEPATPRVGACRALSVEYLGDGAIVWLFKPGDYHPADTEESGARQYDVAGAYYTLVAQDGERVWFLPRSSVFSGWTWQSYGVFDGALADLSREDVWRLRLAVQQGRAVWLGRAPPEEEVWGIGR